MTKKDHIKIAEVLKDIIAIPEEEIKNDPEVYNAIIITCFANMLKKDNDNFDNNKFFNYFK